MATKFSVNIQLNLPEKIDWSKADDALEDIAYEVQEAIKIRLRARRSETLERPHDYRGWRIKLLRPKTKADKLREGYTDVYDVPLIRTGGMIGGIKFRRIKQGIFELYLSGRDAKLAIIHEIEGAHHKGNIRPFLGMTQNDLLKAQARFIRWAKTIGKDIKIRRHLIRY